VVNSVEQARRDMIEAAGRTTQDFGLGRIVGQLYALLYFNPSPMSLDDMAGKLKISKASVSTNIRDLVKWSAVRKVWVAGSRRDYYEARTDFIDILRKGILPFVRGKLSSSVIAADESIKLLTSISDEDGQVDKGEKEFCRSRLEMIKNSHRKIALLLELGSGLE